MPALQAPYYIVRPQHVVNEFVLNARVERYKCWGKLQEAFAGGSRELRVLRDKYPKNPSVRIACLYEAGMRQPSVGEWMAAADSLKPFEPLDHVIDFWRHPKAPNGFRIVCDLSDYMNAAHRIVADMVRAQMHVPGFVYNIIPTGNVSRRTGRNGLMTDLLSHLRQGFTHYRIYDVRDCFNNVSAGALVPPNLPIQWRLYDNTLNLQNLSFRHDVLREQKHFAGITSYRDIITAEGASGPEGLLQGSPASNVVLAYILQNIPQPAPQDGCILLFGDDLIVLSRTRATVDRVDQNLVDFFGQPTLGPLQLLQRASGHLGCFEYLGYEVSYSEAADDWHVGLNAKNWSKLERLRDEETLRNNPGNLRMFTDCHTAWKIRQSLNGHRSLSDPEAILDAIMMGGSHC